MLRSAAISLVCILMFVSACHVDPGALPDQPGLFRYVGMMDLRNLGWLQRRNLRKTVKKLTSVKVNANPAKLHPWWVAKYESGETYWILFEGYQGLAIPDFSYTRIHRFDENWKYLGSSEFPTGARAVLYEAKVAREPVLEMDAIKLRTTSLRQVYVIAGDRVVLVRQEDEEHSMVTRWYYTMVPFVGPVHPERMPEEWIRSLDSKDPVEVLETLIWLSGKHLPSDEKRRPNVNQESIEDATLFETVRYSPLVDQKLLALKKSPNIWIQEAAELAITSRKGI